MIAHANAGIAAGWDSRRLGYANETELDNDLVRLEFGYRKAAGELVEMEMAHHFAIADQRARLRIGGRGQRPHLGRP